MPTAAVSLLDLVADRLATDPPADPGAADLVLTAFEGREALATALGAGDTVAAGAATGPAAVPEARRSYLEAIDVEGFRGIGPPATLELPPGPGLTLVVGRNGSGKSSFAEALELLLTGRSHRWAERTKIWQDGWRNLHHPAARIAASFTVDGAPKPVRVLRRWEPEGDLEDAVQEVDGRPAADLAALGWDAALRMHRPLLSHNELGRILDEGPAKLYDALASLLGLEEIVEAQRVLTEARGAAEKKVKDVIAALAPLRGRCERLDDERARQVVAATSGKKWDLAAVEEAIAGNPTDPAAQPELQRLRALNTLTAPSQADAVAAAMACREAARQMQQAGGGSAGAALDTAHLLEQALTFHARHDTRDCPVCGTPDALSYEWRLATGKRVEKLKQQARAAQTAHAAVESALGRALQLMTPPPASLTGPAIGEVDPLPALEAWKRWREGETHVRDHDAVAAAEHLTASVEALDHAVTALRAAARREVERREDLWRPVAQQLMEWVSRAREAELAAATLPRLRAAERWLKEAHNDLRNQRFAPIAQQVQSNWTLLRQASNVQLGDLRLEGSATQRRLTLDVSIDGAPGSALGVMSQGELNCLALSLFLPRASMPESPFRFMVIDDPVQAMDPAKVEGLARVLERAAADRQVVVFTHDDRLPEAVHRLDIPATIIEVTRREQSVVHLRERSDPVRMHIEDAFAVAHGDVPPEALRVVPGFCRAAIEAACARTVTRRMLREGHGHDDVDAALGRCRTLNTWLALLLFGEPERGGDVMTTLNNKGLAEAADVVAWCNQGSHGAVTGDTVHRVRAAERFALGILAQGEKIRPGSGTAGAR